MNNIMIDLETLDTRPTAAILSLGAVFFDKSGLGKEFYHTITLDSCLTTNLSVSGDTFKWWMAQKGEARQALFVDNVELRDALHDFTCWLAEYCDTKTVKVWGNGADFDNVILQHAYAKAGMEIPWHFWNNRCYRTTCDLLNAKQRKQEGVYHNALDDAKSQAKHLVQTLTARAVW
jgi:hypothetical protein